MSNIQNQYRPDYAVPPGDTLKELMDWYGMICSDLADMIDYKEAYIEDVIAGKQAITVDFAHSLSHVFDLSVGFWIALQEFFDSIPFVPNPVRDGSCLIAYS